MPKRIPIKVLKEVSKELGLTHAILFANDGELQHIVTYGKTLKACCEASDYGNNLKKVLGWPESLQTEPSRVKRLQQKIKDLEADIKSLTKCEE